MMDRLQRWNHRRKYQFPQQSRAAGMGKKKGEPMKERTTSSPRRCRSVCRQLCYTRYVFLHPCIIGPDQSLFQPPRAREGRRLDFLFQGQGDADLPFDTIGLIQIDLGRNEIPNDPGAARCLDTLIVSKTTIGGANLSGGVVSIITTDHPAPAGRHLDPDPTITMGGLGRIVELKAVMTISSAH